MSKTELAITFQNVNKWFDDFQVLKDINLDIKVGEKIVICGPSGSGTVSYTHLTLPTILLV